MGAQGRVTAENGGFRPRAVHGFLYADGLSNTAKCPRAAYADGMVKVDLVGGWATWRPQV